MYRDLNIGVSIEAVEHRTITEKNTLLFFLLCDSVVDIIKLVRLAVLVFVNKEDVVITDVQIRDSFLCSARYGTLFLHDLLFGLFLLVFIQSSCIAFFCR